MLEKTLLKICFFISIGGIICLFVITTFSEEQHDEVFGVVKRYYYDGEKSYITIGIEMEKVITINSEFPCTKGAKINASGVGQGNFFNANNIYILD
ncbi:MAG TPA: hypothetical protein PLX15_00630 [Candidatus Woesearchaeota archaeon]|nr:hypothetical protein [Candidatus Woesearchaeota archaeon]